MCIDLVPHPHALHTQNLKFQPFVDNLLRNCVYKNCIIANVFIIKNVEFFFKTLKRDKNKKRFCTRTE